jgi:tripartite-type tricarboxylate transporter receptor subunit TctC
MSRLLGKYLSDSLGQPVIIENRTGAGGNIAAASFIMAAPDDHTFLIVHLPMMAINKFLYRKTGYDPEVDFKPIGYIGGTPDVIIASPALHVHTLKGLAEYARAHPNKLAFASAGVGSTGHLLTELFKTDAGIQLLHVPYRGEAPAIIGLLSGQVQFMTANVASVLTQVQTGNAIPIAVTSPHRLADLPDVPTVSEEGFPNLMMAGWWGLVAQSKTSPEVIARMNRELNLILRKPDFVAALGKFNIEVEPGPPGALTAIANKDRERWKRVIETSGAKVAE